MRFFLGFLAALALLLGAGHSAAGTFDVGSDPPDEIAIPIGQTDSGPRNADAKPASIRSMTDLENYLEDHPDNPFDAFSPRARERFIESLTFNALGLIGYRIAEVQSELTPMQAHAILALFGVEGTISSLTFDHAGDVAGERSAAVDGVTDAMLSDYATAMRLLNRDMDSPEQSMPLMQLQFDQALRLVDKTGIENLSNDDVEDFLEMAMTLSFYSHTVSHARQMRRAFDEMERRQLATRRQGQQMRDSYVASRMIQDARTFAADRPELKLSELPAFVGSPASAEAPSLWRLSADGRVLTREHFELSGEARAIVVSSPWCSFSHAASAAISRDSGLSDLMVRHSTWILGQSMIPDFADLARWNETYAGRPILIVDRNAQWPWVPSWETPGFYFIRNGKIVTSVVGWPGPEQLAKLKSAFERIGIPPK